MFAPFSYDKKIKLLPIFWIENVYLKISTVLFSFDQLIKFVIVSEKLLKETLYYIC